MNAIELENIRHVFRVTTGTIRRRSKEIVAVDGVSLQIEEGELFGLLGPNGAGKTTIVKILTTLLIPTAGRVTVLGFDAVKDAAALRFQVGFVLGGDRGLYYRLSGRDNLRYFAELYGIDTKKVRSRIEEMLELVGLRDRADERVAGYSRGMKQRLHIARTLLHDPKVLFLDEPTMGLDPVGARDLREIIKRLQSEQKTILLTTHYMFEADALCQRIAILNEGRIVAQGTPEELKELVSDQSVVELEVFGAETEHLDRLRGLDYVDSVSIESHDLRQVLRVQTKLGERAVPGLLASLENLDVGKVSVREATLEDAYVHLVGESE
ncbi:MAG: ABC transporter ATP-binding protein [Chloroflexi bacterium]|nr:ABC transporter ATP-binding protein [Chloroflexota bacterium]